MKTSELEGAALNWAVAKCEGYAPINHSHLATVMVERRNSRGVMQPEHVDSLRYSTNWSQGGPIIEREGIYLRAIRKDGHPMDGTWLAASSDGNTGAIVQWVRREDWHKHYFLGTTPLISAMRCYVASKLGNEIDIPEELK